MTKVSTAPAAKPLEAQSPAVKTVKRVWATPSFEQFDYTITQATLLAGAGDAIIYS